jgi:hypothetical protein
MKKVYHAMLMRGGILIGDVNNYHPAANEVNATRRIMGKPKPGF